MSFEAYPKILAWHESLKSVKGWAESDEGAKGFAVMFRDIWSQ